MWQLCDNKYRIVLLISATLTTTVITMNNITDALIIKQQPNTPDYARAPGTQTQSTPNSGHLGTGPVRCLWRGNAPGDAFGCGIPDNMPAACEMQTTSIISLH